MSSELLAAAGLILPVALFYGLVRSVRRVRVRSAAGLRCPICHAHTAWKSKPRFPDGIYSLFSCQAYRCGGCGARFYFFAPAE